jgi:hypothetical protein
MCNEDFSPMYRQILKRQNNWAKNNLSCEEFHEFKNGKCYVYNLNDNLFTELSDVSKNEFEAAKGGELKEKVEYVELPKMHALHSSSALCVNIFEYWRKKNDYDMLSSALGITSEIKEMHYEGKDNNLIHKFIIFKYAHEHPHPDTYFECADGTFIAIELKFTEPFAVTKKKMDLDNFRKSFLWDKYNKGNPSRIWDKFPQLWNFYSSNIATEYHFLDHIQLTKHLLALANITRKCHLIYLYYPLDCSDEFDSDKKTFDEEINKYTQILTKDNVKFTAISYKELVDNFSKYIKDEEDKKYLYKKPKNCT